MAQFNHPELGGMGQWLRTGMVMIGDMFDTSLKRCVSDLSTELATLLNDRNEDRPADLPLAALSVSAFTQPASDPVLLIERLAELKAKGALTDKEFVAKKAELLRRL